MNITKKEVVDFLNNRFNLNCYIEGGDQIRHRKYNIKTEWKYYLVGYFAFSEIDFNNNKIKNEFYILENGIINNKKERINLHGLDKQISREFMVYRRKNKLDKLNKI